MEQLYRKVKCSEELPEEWGWYDTDKGNLFYWSKEKEWSCRNDRISEEYPSWWLEPIEPTESIHEDENPYCQWCGKLKRLPGNGSACPLCECPQPTEKMSVEKSIQVDEDIFMKIGFIVIDEIDKKEMLIAGTYVLLAVDVPEIIAKAMKICKERFSTPQPTESKLSAEDKILIESWISIVEEGAYNGYADITVDEQNDEKE